MPVSEASGITQRVAGTTEEQEVVHRGLGVSIIMAHGRLADGGRLRELMDTKRTDKRADSARNGTHAKLGDERRVGLVLLHRHEVREDAHSARTCSRKQASKQANKTMHHHQPPLTLDVLRFDGRDNMRCMRSAKWERKGRAIVLNATHAGCWVKRFLPGTKSGKMHLR
jgi:hypothetical protein